MGFLRLSKMIGLTTCLTLILRICGRGGRRWREGGQSRMSTFSPIASSWPTGPAARDAYASRPLDAMQRGLTSSAEKNPKDTEVTCAVVISLVCSALLSAMLPFLFRTHKSLYKFGADILRVLFGAQQWAHACLCAGGYYYCFIAVAVWPPLFAPGGRSKNAFGFFLRGDHAANAFSSAHIYSVRAAARPQRHGCPRDCAELSAAHRSNNLNTARVETLLPFSD